MHALNMKYESKGDPTCDFKPHGNIGRFSGHDAHHVCHRIAFHDRKGEGGLLKSQGSCVVWHLRFGNPLDVQTTSGGFLRSSVVDSFNLREAVCVTNCYVIVFLQITICVAPEEFIALKPFKVNWDVCIRVSNTFCLDFFGDSSFSEDSVSNFWRLESAY